MEHLIRKIRSEEAFSHIQGQGSRDDENLTLQSGGSAVYPLWACENFPSTCNLLSASLANMEIGRRVLIIHCVHLMPLVVSFSTPSFLGNFSFCYTNCQERWPFFG